MSTPYLLSSNERAFYAAGAFLGALAVPVALRGARNAYKHITQIKESSLQDNEGLRRTILKVAGNLLQIIGDLSSAVCCIPAAIAFGKMAIEGLFYKEANLIIGSIGAPLLYAALAISFIGTRICSAAKRNNG